MSWWTVPCEQRNTVDRLNIRSRVHLLAITNYNLVYEHPRLMHNIITELGVAGGYNTC